MDGTTSSDCSTGGGSAIAICLCTTESPAAFTAMAAGGGGVFSPTDIDTDYGNETVTSDWNFTAYGTGAFGEYDLQLGGADYGGMELGNIGIYSSSFSSGVNLDLGQAFVLRSKGNLDVGNDPGIEFAFIEQGNKIRWAIPESASGNATAMMRSATLAGPDPSPKTNDIVTCDYWTAYDSNIDCDTSGTGADLFIQDDLEVEGTIFSHEGIQFEGATADGFAVSLDVGADPVADIALTLPTTAGALALDACSGSLTYQDGDGGCDTYTDLDGSEVTQMRGGAVNVIAAAPDDSLVVNAGGALGVRDFPVEDLSVYDSGGQANIGIISNGTGLRQIYFGDTADRSEATIQHNGTTDLLSISNTGYFQLSSSAVVAGGAKFQVAATYDAEVDTDTLYVDASADDVLIGTTSEPQGVGSFAIQGTSGSTTVGPHQQFYTAGDTNARMQFLNWSIDNVGIMFDSYWDGGWKSSDTGSNFQIYKNLDELYVGVNSGTAAGGAVSWGKVLSFEADDDVYFDAADVFLDASSDSVGINDTTPTFNLDVTGDFRATANSQFDADLTVSSELGLQGATTLEAALTMQVDDYTTSTDGIRIQSQGGTNDVIIQPIAVSGSDLMNLFFGSNMYISTGGVNTRFDTANAAASVNMRGSDGSYEVLLQDASGSSTTYKQKQNGVFEFPTIATAPATCSVGHLYFDTSGAFCACTSTNTWTNMTGVGACT